MDIKNVEQALRICRGAVEATGPVPILSHFCFTEGAVYGSNDVVTVVVRLGSEFVGGVKGDVLLNLLPTLRKQVKVSTEKDQLKISSGKARISLPLLPDSAFLFKEPAVKPVVQLTVTRRFLEGLTLCAATVGDDSMQRAFMGVTLEAKGGKVAAMSSDDVLLSRYLPTSKDCKVDKAPTAVSAVVVQGKALLTAVQAAQEALSASDETASITLTWGKDWLTLRLLETSIFVRLIPDTPPDFEAVFAKVTPAVSHWCKIPDKLRTVIKQAQILTNKDPAASLAMELEDNVLRVKLHEVSSQESALGDLVDSVDLEHKGKAKAVVVIDKLAKALEQASDLSLSKAAVGLKAGSYTCWVSLVE